VTVTPVAELKVGSVIEGRPHFTTIERIDWYDSAMLSAGNGVFTKVGSNIHTDEEYAKSQGLPAVITDGMIMANWCSAMLRDHFGVDYIERGELRTTFIKPVFVNVDVLTRGKVINIERRENGDVRYELDIWCELEDGTKVTDGSAKVEVAAKRPAGR
jgi:hypothetical protein